LMRVAPEAEIYVAKVTDNTRIAKDKFYCIAQAIHWAVQVWKVDIINLSLVLPEMHPDIKKQLMQAIEPLFQNATRKLIFAAAGNKGGNSPQGWPASRDNVMAIHASFRLGSAALFNPSPENEYNFATLSVEREEEQHIHVSGTSFATLIAAGIAANILKFARHKLSLNPDQKKRLYSVVCMAKIFSKMLVKMGDHAYIQLW
ncbi:peptidase S8/S53 domain-containing protein, partial [Diaporthe sp. PMI_573]